MLVSTFVAALILVADPPVNVPMMPPVKVVAADNLVITLAGGDKPALEMVRTPAGPRVRLTFGKTTLEGTRFVMKCDGKMTTITVNAEGKLHVAEEFDPDVPPPAAKK